jgi:predicted transcriptional regulator
MQVKDLIEPFGLIVYAGEEYLHREIRGGYCADLLSDVMGNAAEGDLWITLQVHKNIVAVAALKELSAILLVKGLKPQDDVLELSSKEGITVLGTSFSAFEIAGRLYQLLQK